MSEPAKTTGVPRKLGLDDKVRAEDLLYASMFHPEDKGILWRGFVLAVIVHVVIIIAPLPRYESKAPEKKENVVYVRKYVPPPPKIQRQQIVKKRLTRKVPIPDPTPDEPEPIREPEPEIETPPIPPDMDILLGDPEPPPATGPLIAGVGGVTKPQRIEETAVQPAYPEMARKAKIEGKVYLQAVVYKDGTVGEIQVLKSTRPGLGFEDASVEAVNQWRYKPALQNGRPVDVFITIDVNFTLQ